MSSGPYRTIKSLVFDHVHRRSGKVGYDDLTAEVRKHFPDSAWKKTHWAWYKNQIVNGRFKDMFSADERAALKDGQSVTGKDVSRVATPPALSATPVRQGPVAKDPAVKRIGDEMLRQVRFILDLAAGPDDLMRFKLNRWVFSRLLQDEIRIKRPIKKRLWDSGSKKCKACGQPFKSLKGVELHRSKSSMGYSIENCELLCRECHQEIRND